MGTSSTLATALLLVLPAGVSAQDTNGEVNREDENGKRVPVIDTIFQPNPHAAPVPFGPGEYLEYGLNASIVGGGSGFMAVEAVEEVRGRPSYRLNWYIKASAFFGAAKINQHNYSWFDVENLTSRRYVREDVGRDNGTKRYEIYPEEYYWEARTATATEDGDLASALPLDFVSFIYYMRQMDLEVGQTYSLSRYFKEEGNPVRIEVLRKDRRETDAGTFNTIVVRPVVPGEKMFEEDAKAEIHLSDDENRYVVYMKSETGILGISLTLELKSIVSGGRRIYEPTRDGH